MIHSQFQIGSNLSEKPVFIGYTGGTIMMVDNAGILEPPKDPERHFKEIFASELDKYGKYHFVNICNLDSSDMQPKDWTAIAKATYDKVEDDYVGVVLLHGTDTMHFTAAAVAYALGQNLYKPVILTGSQVPGTMRHGDATDNVLRSMMTAKTSLAEVAITFGDSIFRGCRSEKKEEVFLDAFHSPNFPVLGRVAKEVHLNQELIRKRPPYGDERKINFLPEFASGQVIEIPLKPGMTPEMFEHLVDRPDLKAVILMALGAGNAPALWVPFIKKLSENNILPVLVSSFPGHSSKNSNYAGGVAAREAGALTLASATPTAAYVKACWASAQVGESESSAKRLREMRQLMNTDYAGEFG